MRRAWVFVRSIGRAIKLFFVLLGPAFSWWMTAPKHPTFAWRTAWLMKWCGHVSRGLNVTVHVTGEPARSGIVASNHLGYLDILVLGSVSPQVFLSKSEVRGWPLIGKYAEWAGTQFIDRQRRADVVRQNTDFKRIVENDAVQTIFLEGTSTGGASVLPFKSSLLAPAVENGWKVTPAAIVYTCEGGDPSEHVCWWRNMEFTPHARKLLTLDRIAAHIAFGTPVDAGDDRKALATLLHREVTALKADIDRSLGIVREPVVGSPVTPGA